jgi:hypothetical protein
MQQDNLSAPLAQPPLESPLPSPQNPYESSGKNQQIKKQKEYPKLLKTPKDNDPNVTLAIVASLIIVFGLAALAVYAYTKTN